MSTELSCDTLSITGTARRQIPHLYRFSSTTISVPDATLTRVTTDTVLTSQTIGSTGFVYEAPGRLRNTSGRTLIVRASYSLVWVSVTATRTAWFQIDSGTERHGMSMVDQQQFDPCQSGTAVMPIPHNSTLTLWVYHSGSGFPLSLVAKWGLPSIQLTII